jgi:hypothetical protein
MGWTVGQAPNSPPFDFYSTIDLRCGLIYMNFELHVIIHSVVVGINIAFRWTKASRNETVE